MYSSGTFGPRLTVMVYAISPGGWSKVSSVRGWFASSSSAMYSHAPISVKGSPDSGFEICIGRQSHGRTRVHSTMRQSFRRAKRANSRRASSSVMHESPVASSPLPETSYDRQAMNVKEGATSFDTFPAEGRCGPKRLPIVHSMGCGRSQGRLIAVGGAPPRAAWAAEEDPTDRSGPWPTPALGRPRTRRRGSRQASGVPGPGRRPGKSRAGRPRSCRRSSSRE
jgi:hypothetical protein